MASKRPRLSSSEANKRQERLERFSKSDGGKRRLEMREGVRRTTRDDTSSDSNQAFAISSSSMKGTAFVGTNLQLEKSYLRLTTYPRQEDVRPLSILIKALEHVKRKYQQNEDYEWCNDQLKSIRQDITVQSCIIDKHHPLMLDVYQTHARVLLEQGDLPEFNQCLTNVLQLYRSLENRKDASIPHRLLQAEGEFQAYSILYNLIHKSALDLNMHLRRRLALQQPSPSESPHPRSKKRRRRMSSPAESIVPSVVLSSSDEETHAWQVVRAVVDGCPGPFFQLYANAPHLSPYLMDFLVHRVRSQAYADLVAAVRPTLPVAYLAQRLQLEDEPAELRHFLQQQRAVWATAEDIDCRQSQLQLLGPPVGSDRPKGRISNRSSLSTE